MYDADLSLVARDLRMPPRQPEYRAARSHAEFLINLPLARHEIIAAIDRAWPTKDALADWPSGLVASLAAERFGQRSWTYEFA